MYRPECLGQSWKFRLLSIAAAVLGISVPARPAAAADDAPRPNILFAIADDWGYPHAGAYGDPVVKTPTFDRLAREGVLFENACVSSPSCTPSRGAILTGQWHWRLEGAANLHSVFPDKFTTYPELLERAGYVTGTTGKNWGPGKLETPGRPLAGHPARNFREFLSARDTAKPFCFWLGSADPHRPYDAGSGAASGMDLAQIKLDAAFPDNEVVRSDVADYYFEVQRFDKLVGDAMAALEEAGLLENTIVLMTGDHGMPFPRGKSNLYDLGTRVPLAVRYPKLGKAGRTVEDFVSLTDLAPTYLELAGVPNLDGMTGRSLVNVLSSDSSGRIDPARDHVLFGKERHVPSQESPDMGGYPCRGIRTHDFLYIRNFRPDRWPNGTPDYEHAAVPGNWYADTDNGPTKTEIIEHKDVDEAHRRAYQLCFAKRPADELYDLRKDPDQLINVAADPQYALELRELRGRLMGELEVTKDPRVVGGGEKFDEYPYLGGGPKHPEWEKRNR
jgi:arylsulfatase A-like enzyme